MLLINKLYNMKKINSTNLRLDLATLFDLEKRINTLDEVDTLKLSEEKHSEHNDIRYNLSDKIIKIREELRKQRFEVYASMSDREKYNELNRVLNDEANQYLLNANPVVHFVLNQAFEELWFRIIKYLDYEPIKEGE
jgi:hypothetical protein